MLNFDRLILCQQPRVLFRLNLTSLMPELFAVCHRDGLSSYSTLSRGGCWLGQKADVCGISCWQLSESLRKDTEKENSLPSCGSGAGAEEECVN